MAKRRQAMARIAPHTTPTDRHTTAFAIATFGDPQYDLHSLTTQLNALVTEPKRIEMLWKLVNNSLYVGDIGRNYQLDIKKVPEGDLRAKGDPRALAPCGYVPCI